MSPSSAWAPAREPSWVTTVTTSVVLIVGNAATAPAVTGPARRLVSTAVATMTAAAAQLIVVVGHPLGEPTRGRVEVAQRETAPALEDLRSRAVDLVVGIEYEPVPVARHRDVDRQDVLREDVLLALNRDHPAIPKRGPVRLAACEHEAWAAGHRGTGLDAVVRNVCNRVGGFEPDVRHRSDDGLVLSALVASGRAVTRCSPRCWPRRCRRSSRAACAKSASKAPRPRAPHMNAAGCCSKR
jgi:hypothetical protein